MKESLAIQDSLERYTIKYLTPFSNGINLQTANLRHLRGFCQVDFILVMYFN